MASVPSTSEARGAARPRVAEVTAAAAVAAALAWSYAPSLAALADRWWRDPNYSFGFLVVPIALAIAWGRRGRLDRARVAPRWWGFLPLLGLLGLRVFLYEWNEQYVESATIRKHNLARRASDHLPLVVDFRLEASCSATPITH